MDTEVLHSSTSPTHNGRVHEMAQHTGNTPEQRRYTALLLRVAGKKLDLRSNTVALAICFMCRAYHNGWQPQDSTLAAMAAIFLAAKVDETPRSIRSVGGVIYALQNPETVYMPLQVHWENKKKLVVQEHLLLRFLHFDTNMVLPYKFALNYIRSLGVKAAVAQVATSLLDDTASAWANSNFLSHEIAIAAVYLAVKFVKEDDVPTDKFGSDWWKLFESERSTTKECCLLLLEELKQNEHVTL
eukprot:gb/GECG01001132.1/.p1 GENE.gb/GECG01001132.1/~~gb/GECG01001132.1/.p1  ORF type:complete len:243 (+),score=37.06 gb/GECG01001132.1/:1-729(+)